MDIKAWLLMEDGIGKMMSYHNKYSRKGFETKWVPHEVSRISGAYIDVIKIVGTSFNCNHEFPRGVKRSDLIKKFFASTQFGTSVFCVDSLENYFNSYDLLSIIERREKSSKLIQIKKDLKNKYDEFAIGVYVSLEEDDILGDSEARTKCVYDVGFFPKQISEEIYNSFKEFCFLNAWPSGRGMEVGMLFLKEGLEEDSEEKIIEEINAFSEFRSLTKMRRFLRS